MRIRIKETCQFFGRLYHPGEEVILPAGMKGPYRAVHKSHERISYDAADGLDANRISGEVEDVPLFDVIDEHETAETHTEAQQKVADAAAAISKMHLQLPTSAEEPADSRQPSGEVRSKTHVEDREAW